MVLGLNAASAPVELRERLALSEAELPRAIGELTSLPHVSEAAVLSTCNRVEVYAIGRAFRPAVREIEGWLCRVGGVGLEELRPHVFLARDRDAVRHVLRVAAGLESIVLGEGQILAQVKAAARAGEASGGAGRHLSALLRAALAAGKRVRAETGIATGSVSVSSAAAELAAAECRALGGDLRDHVPLVLGAGRMAGLLLRHLGALGVRRVRLVRRSEARARELAAAVVADGALEAVDVVAPEDLGRALVESEIVFGAATCDEPLVTAAGFARAAGVGGAGGGADDSALGGAGGGLGGAAASSRPPALLPHRLAIDIGVPRCFEPCEVSRDGYASFDVDDLSRVVEEAAAERRAAAVRAERLLEEELADYEAWRDSLDAVPAIRALRERADGIREAELAKVVAKLPQDAPKTKKAVEELARAIVNKLLHGPLAALRGGGGNDKQQGAAGGADAADPAATDRLERARRAAAETAENIRALKRMFGLDVASLAADATPAAARAAGGAERPQQQGKKNKKKNKGKDKGAKGEGEGNGDSRQAAVEAKAERSKATEAAPETVAASSSDAVAPTPGVATSASGTVAPTPGITASTSGTAASSSVATSSTAAVSDAIGAALETARSIVIADEVRPLPKAEHAAKAAGTEPPREASPALHVRTRIVGVAA